MLLGVLVFLQYSYSISSCRFRILWISWIICQILPIRACLLCKTQVYDLRGFALDYILKLVMNTSSAFYLLLLFHFQLAFSICLHTVLRWIIIIIIIIVVVMMYSSYLNHYICSLLVLQVPLVSFLLSYGFLLLACLSWFIIAVDGG